MQSRVTYSLGAILAIALVAAPSLADAQAFTLKQTIPLPGVEGRIDHLAFDAAKGRLFVCALGNDTLEVIDLKKGERLRSIRCPGAPQGVAVAPDTNRLLVANDRDGICQIFDLDSQPPAKLAGDIDLKDDADNVRYDAKTKTFFVGYGDGGIALISAETGRIVGSIKLPAHPEAFELEPNGDRIFVNVPGAHEVSVIDRKRGEVVAHWKTGNAFGNFPMALDAEHHRLFLGCRIPSRLVVLDSASGQLIAELPIARDIDELFFDANHRRIYAVCGEGKLETILQTDANSYQCDNSLSTPEGTRTGLFVPALASLFVAVPRHGTHPAEIRRYETR